jgi:hypothetical protein
MPIYQLGISGGPGGPITGDTCPTVSSYSYGEPLVPIAMVGTGEHDGVVKHAVFETRKDPGLRQRPGGHMVALEPVRLTPLALGVCQILYARGRSSGERG